MGMSVPKIQQTQDYPDCETRGGGIVSGFKRGGRWRGDCRKGRSFVFGGAGRKGKKDGRLGELIRDSHR